MASQDDVKAQAQARFGEYAQGYVESKSHASGEDLERIAELAALLRSNRRRACWT